VIIADTGFFLALANRNDRHHQAAARLFASMKEGVVTTWPVLTETSHLMAARVGHAALMAFLRGVERGALDVFAIRAEHTSRLVELMEKYRELPMDLADASLVLLAEELGTGRILSTDQRDFRTYRWKNRRPFTNVLLP